MDGRSVLHGGVRSTHRDVAPAVEEAVAETLDDQGEADDDDEEENDDDNDGEEMVLTKEEFDVLHAFHRLVPLPALASKLVRVFCDEDLQIAEDESGGNDAVPASASSVDGAPPEAPLQRGPAIGVTSPMRSQVALQTAAKHSPLTRRLSSTHNPSSSVGSLVYKKPHRQVDLAAQTPRIKRPIAVTRTISNSTGDARTG